MRACALIALLAAAAGCAGPLRTFANAAPGTEGCAQLLQWAREKAGDRAARAGESGADEDAREAAACAHREGNDAQARAALLVALELQVPQRKGAALTAKTGSFDDSLARSLAALALSAGARGEQQTAGRASEALAAVRGRALEVEPGDRTVTGRTGTAVSMIDGDCFFCARHEVYGAADGEHVEQLGRWAGYPYVRREDGREQFLLNTRLLGEGQESPQQRFADAMRRRGRSIADASPAALAQRRAGEGEELSAEAPLFRLTLRGFAVGDVAREAGGAAGLLLPVRSEAGEIVVRFPQKLLQRCGRDRRFVAPPDGVDVVVRYETKDGERPVYRAIILRVEDGVAEGA